MECFKNHKKGYYANKCPESKDKDGKAPMKVCKIEDFGPKPDSEAKSVRQIRIRYSYDLTFSMMLGQLSILS